MHLDPTGLAVWLVLGAAAGWLSGRLLTRGGTAAVAGSRASTLRDLAAGILGAYVAAFILALAVATPDTGLLIAILAAALGATLVVALLRALSRPRTPAA